MTINDIDDKVLLLSLSQTYQAGMPENVVLENAYRAWKMTDDPRDRNAKYALAINNGKVRGVFEIISWDRDIVQLDRWAFKGMIAPEPIRTKYLDKEINAWEQGNATPFIYVNC